MWVKEIKYHNKQKCIVFSNIIFYFFMIFALVKLHPNIFVCYVLKFYIAILTHDDYIWQIPISIQTARGLLDVKFTIILMSVKSNLDLDIPVLK